MAKTIACALAVSVATAKETYTQTKILLPQKFANKGGRCMDGSMAGYYYSPPSSGRSSLWRIFLDGGGVCTSESSCRRWARVSGSSNKWPETRTSGLDRDFEDAHQVYVPYCTGDVHSGQVLEPTDAQWGYYFSGHVNFKNIMQHIFDTIHGANQMERVLFAGNSAGGFGVFINCDFLQDYLSEKAISAVVKCAPNGGWFVPGFTEDHEDPDAAPSNFQAWSAGRPTPYGPNPLLDVWKFYLPSNCVKAHAAEPWRCGSVNAIYPYIKAPVFVVENQYDTEQLRVQLALPENQEGTRRGHAFIAYFGRAMRNSTNMVVDHPFGKKGDGLFHPSCYDHGDFGRLSGFSFIQATNDWYFGRGKISNVMVDSCKMPPPGLPCNPTCEHAPGSHSSVLVSGSHPSVLV